LPSSSGTSVRTVRTRSRISSPITKMRAAAVNASVARRRKRASRLTAYSSALPCGMMEKGTPSAAPTRRATTDISTAWFACMAVTPFSRTTRVSARTLRSRYSSISGSERSTMGTTRENSS
jgi:hypothetical protein